MPILVIHSSKTLVLLESQSILFRLFHKKVEIFFLYFIYIFITVAFDFRYPQNKSLPKEAVSEVHRFSYG